MARMSGVNESERAGYWREEIGRCEGSGESIAGYCRKRGLSVSTYHWWKGELRRRGGAASGRGLFAEVTLGSRVAAERAALEVVLANGRGVRVHPGFDGATLAAVVRLLEGLSC